MTRKKVEIFLYFKACITKKLSILKRTVFLIFNRESKMNLLRNAKFQLFCVMSGLLFLMSSCSEDNNSEIGDQSYNGPGSKWDVELDDGDFTITRRATVTAAVDMTVNGTYERLDSGFLKLEVTEATGVDAPDAGDTAWALEVPGYTLFLKPNDAAGQMIPMVSSGDCPTEDFDANWVLVKKANDHDATSNERDFLGTFSYTASTESATLPAKYSLAGDYQNQGADNLTGGTCANGIMQVEDAVMYLTSNGGAIVHTQVNDPEDSSFIFALTQKSIVDISLLNGEFAGILFDENLETTQKLAPVSLSCNAGTCTGNIVADIETNQLSDESATLVLDGTVDDLAPGFVTGTIRNGDDVGNLACMVDVNVLDSDTVMVSCVGQSAGDNTKMFNVLFVSKP